MGIANRVALITGSASGMGKQTAQRMAENGATVVINDIDGAKVDATVAEFKQAGHTVLGTVADRYGIVTVYDICAFLPAIGLLAVFLQKS